jgi:hypothetical protein
MTDADVIATRNDVEMIKRPHLWPVWPFLPLKRRTGDPDIGFMVAGTGFIVRCGNLLSAAQWRQMDSISYPTAEAIVAERWIVD